MALKSDRTPQRAGSPYDVANGNSSTSRPNDGLSYYAGSPNRPGYGSNFVEIRTVLQKRLAQDEVNKSRELIDDRNSCTCLNKYFQTVGNIILYAGMGCSATASGLQLLNQTSFSTIFLFTSTVCFGMSVALLGFAKFTHAKKKAHEQDLNRIKKGVDFSMDKELGNTPSKQYQFQLKQNQNSPFSQQSRSQPPQTNQSIKYQNRPQSQLPQPKSPFQSQPPQPTSPFQSQPPQPTSPFQSQPPQPNSNFNNQSWSQQQPQFDQLFPKNYPDKYKQMLTQHLNP